MARLRGIRTLRKLTAAHAPIHNHFNHQRHLNSCNTSKTTPGSRAGRVHRGGLAAERSV